MADTQENILISLKLDLPTTAEMIKGLKEEVTGLKKATDDLNATAQTSAKAKEEDTAALKRQETAIKKTEEAIKAEEGSISKLRDRNKELTRERNNLSTSTETGRSRIQAINKELDKNNSTIKANVDAYTKQKIGIGDYAGALDKLVPGLGATVNGMQAMTKAAMTFIATPVGLVIAAVALALGSLIAYFKGSEEGQNKLNKIMLIGSTIMEKIMDVAEGVGGAIVAAFENPKQAMTDLYEFVKNNIINRFTAFAVILEGITSLDFKKVANGVIQLGTGVENAIDKVQRIGSDIADTVKEAIVQGSKLADLSAKIDRDERALLVKRAQTAVEVGKLKEEAVYLEGDAKRAVVMEAIALEQQLADAEVAHSETKLAQAKLELKANGDDKAALMKVAEAQAAVLNANATRYEATLKFNKQIASLDEEEAKHKQKLLDEHIKEVEKAEEKRVRYFNAAQKSIEEKAEAAKDKQDKANKDADKAELERIEANKKAAIDSINLVRDIGAMAYADRMAQINNELIANKKGAEEEIAALQQQVKDGIITEEYFASEKARIEKEQKEREFELKRQAFEANKKNQIAQVAADIAEAIMKAFLSMAGVPLIGQILAAAAAVATAAFGAKQIHEIKQQQFTGFARGGRVTSGTRITDAHGIRIRRSNGDNMLATVKTGEVILNEDQQRRAGGPSFFRSLGVPGFAGGGVFGGLPIGVTSTGGDLQLLREVRMMNELLQQQKTVLVLQDFEAVQGAKNEVEVKADLL